MTSLLASAGLLLGLLAFTVVAAVGVWSAATAMGGPRKRRVPTAKQLAAIKRTEARIAAGEPFVSHEEVCRRAKETP